MHDTKIDNRLRHVKELHLLSENFTVIARVIKCACHDLKSKGLYNGVVMHKLV